MKDESIKEITINEDFDYCKTCKLIKNYNELVEENRRLKEIIKDQELKLFKIDKYINSIDK